jgi:hypothetical protein
MESELYGAQIILMGSFQDDTNREQVLERLAFFMEDPLTQALLLHAQDVKVRDVVVYRIITLN